MYLYVFDKKIYDMLILAGRKCMAQRTDINGRQIWIFQSDGKERFENSNGYLLSAELHMAL